MDGGTGVARERTQAVVIGGGVVGCAVLRELAQRGIPAILVEAEPSLCEGTSKANSAIVHTGFDAKPGTIEAGMLRRAAALWPELITELGVPFLEVGAVMLAREPDDVVRLKAVAENAANLGVETQLLDAATTREQAPYLAEEVHGALSIPGESVIDPFWLTRRLAEAAMAAGAQVWTDAAVSVLRVEADGVHVGLADGRTIRADQVLNCAGLWADAVAGLAGDLSFATTPRKGQFLVSEETFGVDRIVLPLPGRMGKGMLVTPIVFGGLLLGPTAEDLQDKRDRGVDAATRQQIIDACAAMVPAVREMVPIRQFAGLRAVSSTGDYILRPSTAGDRLFHVTGIRSTGISASPAIAEHVVDEVTRLRGWERGTRRQAELGEMSFGEEAGEVVCVCRSVSVGEIRAAMRPPLPATTLDAAKRGCGTTFGDCQGNLCAVGSAVVLADGLGARPETIRKHREGSWLFLPGGGSDGTVEPVRDPDRTDAEVVVIGAGLAGIGAALATLETGHRPLVVERTARWGGAMGRVPDALTDAERAALATFGDRLAAGEMDLWLRATASGLLQDGDGWRVMVQTAHGTAAVRTPTVVLATGGYLRPREHAPIAGPRPSGVGTADLVHSALDAGLLPGRVAALLGSGRFADGTARRMQAAGMEVRRLASLPTAVRGDRRLEGVEVGGTWIEADLLVLADLQHPAPFLLRPLGLVDNRPGIPAPAEADGRLPLPGLWSAGTCRAADVDHVASLEDGRHVALAAMAGVEARA
ncbi:MAG TPA: FAD-dependent oxidoreductase [candidate division Zixibacteria bacterium]|nr:FAD-dependent oxidoreductase [candidate division Zixibacteria bacterium]